MPSIIWMSKEINWIKIYHIGLKFVFHWRSLLVHPIRISDYIIHSILKSPNSKFFNCSGYRGCTKRSLLVWELLFNKAEVLRRQDKVGGMSGVHFSVLAIVCMVTMCRIASWKFRDTVGILKLFVGFMVLLVVYTC